ncbi:MAG: hypothetical protein GF329_21600 [Candidatus Lokiarchaeota archaeon]|nr:hypothetical protein [Candidatus Lokiarchaeota archaeon]
MIEERRKNNLKLRQKPIEALFGIAESISLEDVSKLRKHKARDFNAFNRIIISEVIDDTGIIIEYFQGTKLGRKIKAYIFKNS